MKRGSIQIDREFLTSRVARRVFLLVVFSALIPVSVMALISFFQVRGELRKRSDEALHHATKMAGMTLVERLQFLDADLERIAQYVEPQQDLGRLAQGRLLGRSVIIGRNGNTSGLTM